MGEKKRRVAAGTFPVSSADLILSRQMAASRADCVALEKLISAQTGNHLAMYRLSLLRHVMSEVHRERDQSPAQASQDLNSALSAVTSALWLSPDNDAYWQQLVACLKVSRLHYPISKEARQTLSAALEHPAVAATALMAPIASLVKSHAAFGQVSGVLDSGGNVATGGSDEAALLSGLRDMLSEPLLLRLLQLCVFADPFVERLIVLARRMALAHWATNPAGDPILDLTILVSLARQCFITEYLYDESSLEREQWQTLRGQVESRLAANSPVPPHEIAVLACYMPLHALASAGSLAGSSADSPLHSVIVQQVLEPEEEKGLRGGVLRLGDIFNDTSHVVGAFYEENPYPRWVKCLRPRIMDNFSDYLRDALPGVDLEFGVNASITEAPRVLVAGCGTGQHPIESSAAYRDAHITAIDLSLASLTYAIRKTRELGIQNIEYRQGDILGLGALSDRFNLIESIGVLHHLKEPFRGWQVLRSLLKPRGLMRIGLYSRIARHDMNAMRDKLGITSSTPDLQTIRSSRAQLRPLLEGTSALTLNFSPDFYSVSGCRDLLFHVQEHCYSLPEISDMLEQLGLEFLKFQLPTTASGERYRAAYPDDPLMRNLSNWHEFETANPWMFQGMYFMWLRART